MIYHIVSPEYWSAFEYANAYTSETLATEKFIHCSRQDQLVGVLERFFGNVEQLLLLHIDESKLTSALLYEAVPDSNELFPHVYGPINSEAIVEVSWVKKDGKTVL